jgi:glyoxylase-like metal-dependent hydrolase (beta-lactamase superfamily II)
MSGLHQIELPLAYLGSVNAWLLEGEPLTLIDTGAANAETFASLEAQLGEHGKAIEEIELVLLTHHHLDHCGLASAIKDVSGAQIAAHRTTAQWGLHFHERAEAEQRFTRSLMAAHGVPDDVIAGSDDFFVRIVAESRPFVTDRVLSDGEKLVAGGRTLRVVYRPGHSTTDTLFIDEGTDDAFVGDHLLANITSGVELMPTELPGDERRQGLIEYLGNLRKTRAMQLRRCYTGHGPTIEDHRALIDERITFHADRLDRIADLVAAGDRTAFDIAGHLWSPRVAAAQPVLVTWEVLGHLDVLVNRGTIREEVDGRGRHQFRSRDWSELTAVSR